MIDSTMGCGPSEDDLALPAAGSRFTGGNEFFTEAVTARLPPKQTVQDEAKLLGQFAALKTEFGLTDRYRIEDRRAGRE
jgi:hypothetical protein